MKRLAMKRLYKALLSQMLPIQYRGTTRQPVLYLTFDDGPTPNTPRLLDLLARYQVPATFFLLGKRFAGQESIVSRIQNEGHKIGNHSFSHRSAKEMTYSDLVADHDRCSVEIQRVVGADWRPLLVRPPAGHLSVGYFRLAVTRQWQIVMWSKDAIDYRAASPSDVVSNLGKIENGDILLFHDQFTVTYEALKDLIPRYLDRGYIFNSL